MALLILTMTATMAFGTPKEELENQLTQNQEKAQQLQQEMNDIQAQIDQSKASINQLSGEVASLQLQISENEKKLEEQKKELEKNAENLDQRLRNMYKNGAIGFVDVLLSSESVTDLISNVELVVQIYTSDKEVVSALQDQYDATAKIIEELQEQESESQAKLNELNLAQEQLYDSFELIGASKAEVDAATADIQSQLSDIRVQEAQEAQRQAAAQAAASYSAPSSSSTSYAATSVSGGHGTVGTPVSSGSGADVVAYAMQFVGNPYKWGGTSLTNGCDCSGFTMGVYGHFGIGLAHQSEAQRGAGAYVPPSQRQPGDLMWRVGGGHVGIYAGNGMMVHASSPGVGIVYSSVYGSYEYYRLL